MNCAMDKIPNSRNSHLIARRKDEIKRILADQVPKGFTATSAFSYAEFISTKMNISANALVRPGSHYRDLIYSAFESQVSRGSELSGNSKNPQHLKALLHRKDVEISNLKSEVTILRKVISKSNISDDSSIAVEKSYHQEFDALCRVLRELLEYTKTIGISLEGKSIIDKGNSSLGISPEIIMSGGDLQHFVKWSNEQS